VARLEIDAGREGERVAQGDDRLVGIILVADDVGAAGGLCGALLGFVRELRRGDDDRRVGFFGTDGTGGETGCERQQGRRLIGIFCHWKFLPRKQEWGRAQGWRGDIYRHPGGGRDLDAASEREGETPAFAGATEFHAREGGPVLGGGGEAMPGA